jgi:alpha-galactosidase
MLELSSKFCFCVVLQDIKDTWRNTIMNAQNQIRLAEYQTCGQFLTPDMLTVGMGGQTAGEYRAQFYLWAILGAPLILSNDIRTMAQEDVRLESHPYRSWN